MTAPVSRAAELHAIFREGELTQAETDELLALLDRGGRDAEEFLDLVQLDALLEEGLRPEQGHGIVWARIREVLLAPDERGEAIWRAVRSRIRRPSMRLARSRARSPWFLALFPAAAAALVLTLVFFVLPSGSGRGRSVSRREPLSAGGPQVSVPQETPSLAQDVARRRVPATRRASQAAGDQWALPRPTEAGHLDETDGMEEAPPLAGQVEVAVPSRGIAPDAPLAVAEAPGETQPWLAEAEAIEGILEYSRSAGAAWSRAEGKVGLAAGDRVRTALARARVRYASGTELYLNRFTTAGLSARKGPAAGAFLVGGELYIETSKEDRGFAVETPHGRAVAAGTRFGVEAQPAGTTVVVAEGRVTASTDVGGVDLGPGYEVRLPALGSIPDTVRRVRNIEQRFAWAKDLGPKPAGRVSEGLLVLYLFSEGQGNAVHDVSGTGEPVDLVLSGTSFAWLPGGGLSFRRADHDTIASSPAAPRRLYEACTATNELTLEAWFRTGSLTQTTARRIIDYESPEGEPANDRNCSLCQEGRNLNFRLRLAGMQDSTGFVTNTDPLADTRRVYHAVCTYRPADGMKLYVNGLLVGSDARSGALAGAWRADYILSIGNRTRSLDRDWEGDIFLAAMYSRALSPEEVARNYAAGPRPVVKTRR